MLLSKRHLEYGRREESCMGENERERKNVREMREER